MRTNKLERVVSVAWLFSGFAQSQSSDCEEAVIIKRQPVVYVCSGTTTQGTIFRTTTECAPPPTCITTVTELPSPWQRPPCTCSAGVDDIETITTTGSIAGTATLPASPGGPTTVIVTETPGDVTTITTTGPTPGTMTLTPDESGETKTAIVTETPTGSGHETTITVTGEEPGTTITSDSSGDVTEIVTQTRSPFIPSPIPHDSSSIGSSSSPTTPGPSSTTSSSSLATFSSLSTKSSPSSTASSSSTLSSSSPTTSSSSSTLSSSSSTTSTTSSTTSSSSSTTAPSPTCEDVENPDFTDGTMAPWYISDQMTADSGPVAEDPGSGSTEDFALIPSQTQFAQVYLNQELPSCGSPPPEVTLNISFKYQFTGDSSGCTIQASVNRSPDNIVDFSDDGSTPGEWETYQGSPIQVQLTYDPLFTIKLSCEENTPNTPAILITDIHVY